MSTKKTYVAVYERDAVDDAWNVRIDGLDGCQTYGRSLRQAQSRIREALGLWLDSDPANLRIEDRMPAKLAAVAKRATTARHDAELAGAKAQQQVAGAARELTDLGLSRRDTADLLGLSHQRIQQLVDAG
jgi:predicted RNase H-like HicB family nuclease